MTAYYNEHDAKAAAWLRELIARNLIAPGHVDERSIVDVQPGDLRGFTQCHFFAGIGVWSYALRNAGWADSHPVWTGSCPCQPFSASGKSEGTDDTRHLWPTWVRLIRECRPHVIFGEQVASKAGLAWLDFVSSDLEHAGYAIGAADLCAAGVGAPHIRQRLYFVADSQSSDRRSRNARNRHEQSDADRQEGTGNPRECRTSSIVADSGGYGIRQLARELPSDEGEHDEWPTNGDNASLASGTVSELADTDGRRGHENARDSTDVEQYSLVSGNGVVDDAVGGRRQQRESERQTPTDASETSTSGIVGNASNARLQGSEQRRPRHHERNGSKAHGSASEPSAPSGFWSDAEWLPCRDGKARPIEPGSFPLAYGSPARVGRLRGYGNAIVAPLAQAFIEAYLDTLDT